MLVDARLGVDDRHSIDDVTFHGAAGGGLVAVAEGTDDELVIVAPCGHGRCQRPRDACGADQPGPACPTSGGWFRLTKGIFYIGREMKDTFLPALTCPSRVGTWAAPALATSALLRLGRRLR